LRHRPNAREVALLFASCQAEPGARESQRGKLSAGFGMPCSARVPCAPFWGQGKRRSPCICAGERLKFLVTGNRSSRLLVAAAAPDSPQGPSLGGMPPLLSWLPGSPPSPLLCSQPSFTTETSFMVVPQALTPSLLQDWGSG